MSECTAGKNTVCGTCEQCTFRDDATQRECSGAIYDQWFDTNCCFDSEGNEVSFSGCLFYAFFNIFLSTIQLSSCSIKAVEDMRIRARESRHHWASPETLPLVDVVQQPQYSFGRAF